MNPEHPRFDHILHVQGKNAPRWLSPEEYERVAILEMIEKIEDERRAKREKS